jgi:peroxidase
MTHERNPICYYAIHKIPLSVVVSYFFIESLKSNFLLIFYSYGLSYEDIEKGLPTIDTSRTLVREVCPPFLSGVECRPGKYRRVDGLCNNLQHPTWGAANTPFQRLIGPLYSDSISSPRISVTGHDLPLSRVVSRTIHPDEGYHDHAGTVMIVAWGQFMDHDLTLTATPLGKLKRSTNYNFYF